MKYIDMLQILCITTGSGNILNPGNVSTLSLAALWFNVREVIHYTLSKTEHEIIAWQRIFSREKQCLSGHIKICMELMSG